ETEELVAALSDPGFHDPRPARVEHLQTHISHLFVAPPYAYKLKKPVRLDFLDFSTAAARKRFCEEEVRLNRRLCPEIYLGVVAVARTRGGSLALGAAGSAVDHLV